MSIDKAFGLLKGEKAFLESGVRLAIVPFDTNLEAVADARARFFTTAKTNNNFTVSQDAVLSKITLDLTADPIEISRDDMKEPTIQRLAIIIGPSSTILNLGTQDPAVVQAANYLEDFLYAVAEPAIHIPENNIYRLKQISFSFKTALDLPPVDWI